jgi:hypothetical protein
MRHRLQKLRGPDALGTLRRAGASAVDGLWAPTVKRLHRAPQRAHDPDADPHVALVTVNFSTTHYLKLMLTTLGDQHALELLSQVVIVDNGSRDGGVDFLRRLAVEVDRVTLIERRHFPTHAHGMRAGARAVRDATHLLFCDTDVIWRNPDALLDLMAATVAIDAALAGEVRRGPNPRPDIQASLFLVRRDVYDDPRIPPPIDHGSPAYRLQRSIFDRSLPVVDFPTNHGGYALHRGRAGVAAAARHPRHNYARVQNREPHYMGVPNGAEIWAETEARYASLVAPDGEAALIERLQSRLR